MCEVSSVNFKAIKGEIQRQSNRTLKKLTKCSDVPDASSNKNELQVKLRLLNEAEGALRAIKSAADPDYNEILKPILHQLGLANFNPPVVEKEKKVKPPRPSPRKPYRVFTSTEGVEIWVGRRAEDNDELSCNPEHRHNDEWWMHVAGSAGSHVVIKCTDNDFPVKYRETLLDAAYLAAVNSKGSSVGRAKVSLTRCRNVAKPRGAKDGLVQLHGDVLSVTINLSAERDRAVRLKNDG